MKPTTLNEYNAQLESYAKSWNAYVEKYAKPKAAPVAPDYYEMARHAGNYYDVWAQGEFREVPAGVDFRDYMIGKYLCVMRKEDPDAPRSFEKVCEAYPIVRISWRDRDFYEEARYCIEVERKDGRCDIVFANCFELPALIYGYSHCVDWKNKGYILAVMRTKKQVDWIMRKGAAL